MGEHNGLFLGAGASVFLGFPTSNELTNDLKTEQHPIWKMMVDDSESKDIEEILAYCEEINTISDFVLNNKFLKRFIMHDTTNRSRPISYQISQIFNDVKSMETTVVSNLHEQFKSDKINDDVLTKTLLPFFNFLTKNQDHLDIFTTNYDSVISHFARQNARDFAYHEGFIEEQGIVDPSMLLKKHHNNKKNLNVFKLHGSLDWYTDSDGKVIKKQTTLKPQGTPVIIPPMLGKQTKNHPLLGKFFTLYENKIMEYENFVVIGFSLRDTDITALIEKRIKGEKNVVIISPNCEVNIVKNILKKLDLNPNIYYHSCQELEEKHRHFHTLKTKFNQENISHIVDVLGEDFIPFKKG